MKQRQAGGKLKWLGDKLVNIRIRPRLFAIYLIGGLLPLLLISIYLMQVSRNLLIEQTKESELVELTLLASYAEETMRTITDVSNRIFLDTELEHIAFTEYESYAEVVRDYKKFTKFGELLDIYYQEIKRISMYMENQTISNTAVFNIVNGQIRGQDWYRDTVENPGKVVWSFQYDPSGLRQYPCLSRLIRNVSGRTVGVLAIYMRNERFTVPIHNRSADTAVILDGKDVICTNNAAADRGELLGLAAENTAGSGSYSRKVSYQGEDCLLSSVRIVPKSSDNYFDVVSIRPYQSILEETNERSMGGIFLITISITVSLVLITLSANSLSSRINRFKVQMHRAADGDFGIREEDSGSDEIGELFRDLNIMIAGIQRLISAVYEEKMLKEQLNSRQKDVEFKMLASQINPHFLYNTLETIRMKARVNGQSDIEELVKMLAKIMRRNIQVGDKMVTLASELKLVEYYLKIQQYRFGERISYGIDLECDITERKIMPLLIQPIVENAFVHGLETKEGSGGIRILIRQDISFVIIVEDDGTGIPEDKLSKIREGLNDFSNLDRGHIGLSNVNQRIKLMYGDAYGLTIESREGRGTRVCMELPGSSL